MLPYPVQCCLVVPSSVTGLPMESAPTHQPELLEDLISCQGCDLLYHKRDLQLGEAARCARCGDVIQTRKPRTIDRSLAASLAALFLLLVSLCTPFLSLSRSGLQSSMTMLNAAEALWNSQMRWLGCLTLGLIVLLPLARYSMMCWVLGRLFFRRRIKPSMLTAFRWSIRLEPWAMVDIFIVGVVVSLVKISSLANLEVGLAFWALLGLTAVSLFLNYVLCKDTIWDKLTCRA